MKYVVLLIVFVLTACGGAAELSGPLPTVDYPPPPSEEVGTVSLHWDPSSSLETRSIRAVHVKDIRTLLDWDFWPDPWIQPGETQYLGDLPLGDDYSITLTLEDGIWGLGGMQLRVRRYWDNVWRVVNVSDPSGP